MKLFRLLSDVLDQEARKGLLLMVPIMLMASASDVAVVGASSAFASMVVDPGGVANSTVGKMAATVVGEDPSTLLYGMGALTLLVAIVGNSISLWSLRAVAYYGQEQAARLSAILLNTYLKKPYSFFLERDISGLASRVLQECRMVIANVLMGMLQVSARSVGAVVIIGALIVYDPGLSGVLITVLGSVYVGFYLILRTTYRKLGRRRVVLLREIHHTATESLEGVKEIQLYDLADEASSRFLVRATEYAHVTALFSTMASSMRFLIETIGVGAIVLVAVYFHWSGRPTSDLVPILGAYGIASLRLLPVFQTFFLALSKVQLQLASLEGIHADLESRQSGALLADHEAMNFQDEVALTDARYTYPLGDRPVFDGLDLAIARGEWVAFVGTTGAGKSTIVDNLLGLLTPESGAVTIDGVPLTPDAARSWQKGVAYVPQHIFIRDESVAANISFSTEMSRESVERAARMARLHDFIVSDLPDGYDTALGARGLRLSGGQRQRVGLARAIARAPEFLVLDEATSALDNETEAAVVTALRESLPGTTVVMIAHRLSSTRHCDRILVLERGKIIESGSYDDLVAQQGRFYQMVQAGDALS